MQPYGERTPEVRRFQQDAYDLVILLRDTGARYGEAAGLEWRQIDLDDRSLQLWRPKVENESVLYMTERVYRVLARRHRETNSPYVFTNKKGEKRGYSSSVIRKAFRRAGLDDCSIHTLRHTCNPSDSERYEYLRGQGDSWACRHRLQPEYADIKTTMRYAHLEQRDVSSKARDVISEPSYSLRTPRCSTPPLLCW